MRLADFIELEMEAIVSRWEEFAGTLLPAARGLDSLALRDHAEEMLQAIAADLRNVQTPAEQEAKSRGQAIPFASETAAHTHAILRAASGFSIRQLLGEYRALRASVLRQYLDLGADDPNEREDIGRFNEALDQAVAESVDYFTTEVDRWRHVFLGLLGHDLRTPLNSIQLTAELISRRKPGPELAPHIDRMVRSSQKMAKLIDGLLDFNRLSMDGYLDVEPRPADLAETCRQEIALQKSAHPSARIELDAAATCPGVWDASRIRQAVGSLISTAIQHRSQGPVRVRLQREGERVRVEVENQGPTLSTQEIDSIFDPHVGGRAGIGNGERGHLGLGLFIVRQTAEAHGGTVDVHSAEGRTCFSMVLPVDASAARRGLS